MSYLSLWSAGLNVFHFSKRVIFFEAQWDKTLGKFRMLLKNLSCILVFCNGSLSTFRVLKPESIFPFKMRVMKLSSL